jgi:hypothetical protein
MEYMAPNAEELMAEPLVGLDQIRAGVAKLFRLPGFKITWEPTKAEFLGEGDVVMPLAATKCASMTRTASRW